MSASHSIRRLAVIALPLILLLAVTGYISGLKPPTTASPASAVPTTAHSMASNGTVKPTMLPLRSAAPQPAPPTDDAATIPAFRTWLSTYQAADESLRPSLVNQVQELAAQRRARMARLIRENPEQALTESLRLHEYAALPDPLKAMVERPFSETARYDYYPVCGAPAGMPDHTAGLGLAGVGYNAFTYGRRVGLMSKRAVPAQGITLDDSVAIHDTALRALEAAEVAMARQVYPLAQQDPALSFVTGEPISGEPLVALGGGKLYHMANSAELTTLNDFVAELEAMPGPDTGADVLHFASPPADADGSEPAPAVKQRGFNFAAARVVARSHTANWTTSEKKVFMIRVDFSDAVGLPFSQAETAAQMNGPVSNLIRGMSYGKTWINATVSANIYRMPQSFRDNYFGDTLTLNHKLLRDARNTFRTNRYGADATVNIGPVNDNNTGGDTGVGDYDIVGMLFPALEVRPGGGTAGGIAGGHDLWMRGSIDTALFVHEFGHNYSLNHSNFWKTTDGSIIGAGGSIEYGDDYDIMGLGRAPEGHFNVQGKSRLNWLTTSQWNDATVNGSNTYRIYRQDDPATTGTPRGIRLTRSATAGIEEYIWVGYRPAYAKLPNLARGAYLHWQRPGETRSDLLDTTPATSGVKTDAGLAIGRTFADATSNAFITPLGVGGTGAESYLDVRVNIGPYPGNAAPVAAAITGPSTVPARSSATFTVSATDANNDALAYYWEAGDGSIRDSASSISQKWIVGGTYTVNATVSDMKGGSHTVSKTVTVTDPLDTWTRSTVGGINPNLEDLVYGKGRFITADLFSDNVFTSWDGVSWNNVGGLPDMDQAKFAFGAGVFVAAGRKNSEPNKAQVCWSDDGRRWQPAGYLFNFPPMRAITYGNGRFVALGENGSLLISTDGKTWGGSSEAGGADFRSIAWGGAGWVAMAANPATVSPTNPDGQPQVIWTSPNASGWTNRGPMATETFTTVYKLRSFGGICYALGRYLGVRYSTDSGVTWQDANLPPGTRWTTLDLAQAPDGTLIAPSWETDVGGEPGALLVSPDGIQWARSNGNADVGKNVKTMVYGAGGMVSVENNGAVRRSGSFYPTNSIPLANLTTAPATGSARELITFSASATDSNGDPLIYVWDFGPQFTMQDGGTGVMFFPFGTSQSITLRVLDERGGMATLPHSITVSDPARTFTNRTTDAAAGRFNAIASGGGLVVAVGEKYFGSFSAPYAWSTDGTTWTKGTFASGMHMAAITRDSNKFIAVGSEWDPSISSYVGKVLTSPDGATWTTRFTGGKPLRAIAVGNRYVATGESGYFVTSTDGTSWGLSRILSFEPYKFDGLSWSGSTFLLTGFTTSTNGDAQAWISSDGFNWDPRSSNLGVPAWQSVRKNAWLNDRFVTSGWYSKLLVSTDNATTFSTNRTSAEDLEAYAYGSGIYFTAGVDRNNSNADVDVMSLDGKTWYSYPAYTDGTTTDRYAATFFNNTIITVGDEGSIRQSQVITPAKAAYTSWYATNFPGSGVASLPDSDPDGDGLSNFAEYALNLTPGKSNSSVTEGTNEGGRGWIKFTLPAPARPDIRYIVEGTTALATPWTVIARKEGEAAWTWLGGGMERMIVKAPSGGSSTVEIGTPDGQTEPYFIRLKVEAR